MTPSDPKQPPMPRVVMFVTNDVRWDVRVQREATTLAEAGYEVTVIGRPSDPATQAVASETWNGITILRVPVPGGLRRRLLEAGAGRAALARPEAAPRLVPAPKAPASRATSPARLLVRTVRATSRIPVIGSLVRGLDFLARWRFGVMAWGRAAAQAAPPADVWHAHDLSGIPAALYARARHGGRLVYDAHELFTEAGDTASRPRWARAVLRRYERRAILAADGVVTVNDGLAAELRRIAEPRRLVVVRNTPPAPRSLLAPSDRLRAALSLPAGTRIVLYHGGFQRDRGLPELITAMGTPGLELAHLVLMGSGPMAAELRGRADATAVAGRVHVIPPVPPEVLGEWVASADVGAMPNQPRTANERISTPNKLYECLAAGIPVVSSDFPERRRIIVEDPDGPLGALCDPTDPDSIGGALRAILDLDQETTAGLRARCLEAARLRWNWETQAATLLGLYAGIAPAPVQGIADGAPSPQRVTFALPSSGAFDARTRRMAVGLAERGHDVLVIARSEPGLPDQEDLGSGAVLRRVDAGTAPANAVAAGPRGPFRLVTEGIRMTRTALRSRTQTAAARRADRPATIYHAMGFLALPVAIDLAARAGAPFVYDARDLYAEGNNIARLPRPLRWLFVRRERAWARRAAAVLTVNASLAAELERRLGIPRPAVVMNTQLPWTPPEPRPDLIRVALGLAPMTPIVLYHGGFMRDRGLAEVIAAMATTGLESAHLVLMGAGPLAQELRSLAATSAASAERIHFLPPVPPAELLEWVASADVGVMANQPRTINERLSTPNKLFECLAAGTPVVSSDFPERRRIVAEDPDGPLGALCDPADPASIGTAIRSVLDLEPAAALALRQRCLDASAVRYDWASQFAVLLETYEGVTGARW